MNLMDRARVFQAAANIIRHFGHYKGSLGNAKKGFCLVGAMLWASGNNISLHKLLVKDAREYFGNPGIANWNDQPERTKEEVIDFLEDCAAKLRLQAQELVNDGKDH